MRVLANVPKRVKRGEPIEVKLLISHPMESGQRRDEHGRLVPRQIIHDFRCTYNGAEVIRLSLHPAIAANPFLGFAAIADASGTLEFTWTDDSGTTQTETAAIEVEMRALLLAAALLLTAAAPRSGRDDASPAVQAMQDDDSANPAMLWVQQGRTLWAQGCAACHGAPETMRGAAARYPVVEAGRVLTLAARIDQCRTTRMGAPPWPPESEEMLATSALIGLQSRGLPMAVDAQGEAAPFVERGRTLFTQRMGQLNLSCAQCHDTLAGQRLGGSRIPEGHPNGYPLYRLEWQSMGSLDRRLRNCMTGVRAEPFPPTARRWRRSSSTSAPAPRAWPSKPRRCGPDCPPQTPVQNALQRVRGAAWRRPAWVCEHRSAAAIWAVSSGAQQIRVG